MSCLVFASKKELVVEMFSKWIGSIFHILIWFHYQLSKLFEHINSVFTALVHKKECLAVPTNVQKGNSVIPRSVNYHLTRQCNYNCGFCFHTATTSFVLPIDIAKKGLRLLKDAGKT